jgi:hypothetical protein
MFKIRSSVLAGSALMLASVVAGAQVRSIGVPAGMMPPVGLCRVWVDGVPMNRQPAPTTCQVARATAPLNSRILYGANSQVGLGVDPRYGTVNGNYDPRYVVNGAYDPRIDPRNRLYDVRYANQRAMMIERERIALEQQRIAERNQVAMEQARMAERNRIAMEQARIERARVLAAEQGRMANRDVRTERDRREHAGTTTSNSQSQSRDPRY